MQRDYTNFSYITYRIILLGMTFKRFLPLLVLFVSNSIQKVY